MSTIRSSLQFQISRLEKCFREIHTLAPVYQFRLNIFLQVKSPKMLENRDKARDFRVFFKETSKNKNLKRPALAFGFAGADFNSIIRIKLEYC